MYWLLILRNYRQIYSQLPRGILDGRTIYMYVAGTELYIRIHARVNSYRRILHGGRTM